MRHEQQNKTGNLLITMTAWIETRLERRIQCQLYSQTALYRFTKGLTQNLNLRTNLKLKYNINSLNYIQPNFRFQASFLYYWTMSFTFSTWSVV